MLSYPLILLLVRLFAAMLYRLAPVRRHIVETNLWLRFPDLDAQERGHRWCGEILPRPPLSCLRLAWDGFPSDDEEADAIVINRLVESVVSQYPEQYLWCTSTSKPVLRAIPAPIGPLRD